MSRRFFTADFHLGDELLLDEKFMCGKQRSFQNADVMNMSLIQMCNHKAKVHRDKDGFVVDKDVIVHLGDFACTGFNRGFRGLSSSPQAMMQHINASFINIRGNHDNNNSVKSAFNSVQLNLGRRYPSVTAGHYPSYDDRSSSYVKNGFINLCGHVHSSWKHCLDLDKKILNVNVGVDAWKYNILSEDDVIKYIDFLLRKKPDDLFRCKKENGKNVFFGDNKI